MIRALVGPAAAQIKETKMTILTRRSLLRRSLGLTAAGALTRPHLANAAATTAEVWWTQGFVQEEDVAFKKLIADYEKATSGPATHHAGQCIARSPGRIRHHC